MTMTPLGIRQYNERVRTLIAVLSNGGLALFGAFAGFIYAGDTADGALAMVAVGSFLMMGAFVSSALLREEE
jgi:hypothetical protein